MVIALQRRGREQITQGGSGGAGTGGEIIHGPDLARRGAAGRSGARRGAAGQSLLERPCELA